MENKNNRLEILVQRNDATELAAPIMGFMDGRISESMSASLEVKLINKKSKEIVFHDTGRNTALEVAGAIEEITIGK
jgi:tocopherol cyclase